MTSFSFRGKRIKKKTQLLRSCRCVKFDSHPLQICQDAIIVRQPRGTTTTRRNSNDLLTAMRETVSSAFFGGRGNLKVPLPRQNVDKPAWSGTLFTGAHEQNKTRNPRGRDSCGSWELAGSECDTTVSFLGTVLRGHKQGMIYRIVHRQSASSLKAEKIDGPPCRVKVWPWCVKPVTTLSFFHRAYRCQSMALWPPRALQTSTPSLRLSVTQGFTN